MFILITVIMLPTKPHLIDAVFELMFSRLLRVIVLNEFFDQRQTNIVKQGGV